MSTGHHNLSCTVSGNFVLLQISLQWETSAPTWIQRGAIILYPRISFHYSNTVFHCCYFCPIKCYCCVTTGNSKDWCKFDLDINEKLYHLDKLQIIYATSFLKAFSTFSSFLRADMTPLICPPPTILIHTQCLSTTTWQSLHLQIKNITLNIVSTNL